MIKRFLAGILVVFIAMVLFPLSAAAEMTDVLDEAAVLALNHAIFEANQLDAIFSRHESVAYTFVYPEEPGRTWFVWETKDGVYQEWGTDMSQYETDREVCQQPSRKLSTLNSLSPVTAARRFSPAIKTADIHVCTSATNRKAVPQRVILMHIPICGVM